MNDLYIIEGTVTNLVGAKKTYRSLVIGDTDKARAEMKRQEVMYAKHGFTDIHITLFRVCSVMKIGQVTHKGG
jgi:hypothetical protein